MSATEIYLWGLGIGVLLGWQTCQLVYAIAYKLGIVEYRGTKATKEQP